MEENIRTAHELGIHHISYYGLTIEKGTVFDDEYKSGQLNLPDDESYKKAFNTIVKTCAEYGYEQYEISNYSKEDYRCRHNLNYWNYGSYLGFGPSAHGAIISRRDSILHAIRYGNIRDVLKYIHSIVTNDSAVDFEENLDSEKINIEKLLLGLRTTDGYKLNDSERNENLRFNKAFHELLQSFINDGFIKSTPDNRIAINREYMV
ncbi:MAG: hypothetical protein GY855_04950, partial [candidate division Zixibacteria bacterium]|nr:hypothetical protein [candidate division Zixibacteria bacterium]